MNSEQSEQGTPTSIKRFDKEIFTRVKDHGKRLYTFIKRIILPDREFLHYEALYDNTAPLEKKKIPTEVSIKYLEEQAGLYHLRSINIQKEIIQETILPTDSKFNRLLTQKISLLEGVPQRELIREIFNVAFQQTQLFQYLRGTGTEAYIREGKFLRTIDGRRRIDFVNGITLRYGQVLLSLQGLGGNADSRSKEINITQRRPTPESILRELLEGQIPDIVTVFAHEYLHSIPGGTMPDTAISEAFAVSGEPNRPSEIDIVNRYFGPHQFFDKDGSPQNYPGMRKISLMQASYHIGDLQLMGYSMPMIGQIINDPFIRVNPYYLSIPLLTEFVDKVRRDLGYSEEDLAILAKERDAQQLRDMAYIRYTASRLLYKAINKAS